MEAGVEEGSPFSARTFGEHVLKDAFEGHQTLLRMWLMLSEVHRLLWATRDQLPANGKRALAQTTCCLKATATAALQKGQWVGAW
eukprot:13314204-Heterocapsa_arctica.AAC.1